VNNTGSLLCIDAGNTLVKWCLHASVSLPFEQPSAFFSHPTTGFKPFSGASKLLHQQLAPCLDHAQSPVQAVLLSNVLGPDFERSVREVCEVAGVALHVLTVNRHAEVQSAYETPAALGKDRWAACMALTQVSQAAVNLLVSFGTATTFDIVVKNTHWQHLGGYIVPGIETMLQSLHSNTAELPKVDFNLATANTWPVSTQQAIGQGVARMQAAMVQSIAAQLEQEHREPAVVWLSGGFAPMMQASLPQAKLLEHAVFKGLLVDYLLGQKGAAA
jgi:type III pantothenate kinase